MASTSSLNPPPSPLQPLSIQHDHKTYDKSLSNPGKRIHPDILGSHSSHSMSEDKPSWFPFPRQASHDMSTLTTTPTTSSSTTFPTAHRDLLGHRSEEAYAGTFHGLGTIPHGQDYGQGSSGMDALSEAAAARSAEDRAHVYSDRSGGETRWEYKSLEPERRVGSGFWKTKPKEQSPKRKRDDVEKDVNELRGHIHELIHMMRPFASRSPHHDPAPPPLYLQSHFHRMSKIIHSSLLAITPHVAPHLDGFSLDQMHIDRGDRSDAEREMEVIRKRRDMLISRAAAQAKSNPIHSRLGIEMGLSRSLSHSITSSRSPSPAFARSASRSVSPVGPSLKRHAAIIDEYGKDDYASRPRDPRDGTPLGRCHGCGSGALHWRRGPDGPKSLCESCGLHYAKLSRSSASPRSYQQPFTTQRIPEIKGRT